MDNDSDNETINYEEILTDYCYIEHEEIKSYTELKNIHSRVSFIPQLFNTIKYKITIYCICLYFMLYIHMNDII